MGFSYPAVDLSIYSLGHTGKCMVSCYDSDKLLTECTVHIIDTEQPLGLNLLEEMVEHLEEFPKAGEVFVLDLGPDGIHRAVCNDNKELLLVDGGEVLQSVSAADFNIFSISDRAKNITARAIPCKVLQVLDGRGNEIRGTADICDEMLFFTVNQIERDNLSVVLSQTIEANSDDKAEYLQLTEAEKEMLFEEPESTSNALKAVQNHNPKDDSRLCPHYDHRTGACFKGNACRFEHQPHLPDGLTRDTKTTMNQLLTGYTPMIGPKLKACITHIENVHEFYAHFPEIASQTSSKSLQELKQHINSIAMVERYQPVTGLPDLHDLILVRRNGIYYRGKVVDQLEKGVSAFFLDYGSIDTVALKDVLKWMPEFHLIPAQVQRCSLGNVTLRNLNDDEAYNAFRDLVLDAKCIEAEILSNKGDVIVKLFDENGSDIGEKLKRTNIVESGPILIPDGMHIPG